MEQSDETVENKKSIKVKKILHILSSNKYSGAENVACQIISLFENDEEYEFAYASPNGEIKNALEERSIRFIPIQKMSVKEVKKLISSFKPDVIHAHDPKAICLSVLSSQNIKIVAHIHNNRPDFRKRTLLSCLFNFCVKSNKIKKILWVSNSCFNQYYNNKNVKISSKSLVFNNIINCNKLAIKAENAELKDGADLVYLGRLSYQKNSERLIEIVKLVKQKKQDVSLAVIGDGDLKQILEEKIKENNLEENIKLYGFLSNGYAILKNSKIFLLTSRFEGNPMCVLEAQSFGLPVVSTEIDELKTLIKQDETGYLYNTNEEASEFILNLLENNELYNRLKKDIKKFSSLYNNTETYKNCLIQLYVGEDK